MSLFEDSVLLLKGSAFVNVSRSDSFIYLEGNSFFSSYIVPTTAFEEFNTEFAEKIMSQVPEDKIISLYIPEEFKESFSGYLTENEYSLDFVDCFLLKDLKEDYTIPQDDNVIVEVASDNFDEFLAAALKTFPEWSNEEDYTRYFDSLAQSSSENKIFKDFMLKVNDTVASFGSIILDKDTNLAYVHNAGTLDQFRRQGYFTTLNMSFCNQALFNKINRIYVIVEQGEESHQAYQKMGFTEQGNYFIYTK